MFTAAVIASLGLAQKAEAGVTWVVSQSGSDLVMETTGSLSLPSRTLVGTGYFGQDLYDIRKVFGPYPSNGSADIRVDYWRPDQTGRITATGGDPINTWENWDGFGMVSPMPFIINVLSPNAGVATGNNFGVGSNNTDGFGQLTLDTGAYTGAATTVSPTSTITMAGRSIAEVFGTNLNNGPVVVFTVDGTGDTISIGLAITPVDIDIKPGSPENTVNLGSRGITKVAILGSVDFDATQVDPSTVKLADARVRVKGNGQPLTTIQDTNGDGFLDLVLHIDTEGFDLTDGDVSATLTGRTLISDEAIEGEDVVRVVP